MGQAKRRGTLEQRIEQAIARDNQMFKDIKVDLCKGESIFDTHNKYKSKSPITGLTLIAALATLQPSVDR